VNEQLMLFLAIGIVFIFQIFSFFYNRNQSNSSDYVDRAIKPLPELISSQVSEKLEKRLAELSEKNQATNFELIKQFDSLKNQVEQTQLKFQHHFTENINQFKESFHQSLRADFEKLGSTVEKRLDHISQRVRENLDEGFKQTNLTFAQLIERLTKIDEAQKKIDQLSTEVVNLQDVLTDKKSRGIFGEVQLNQTLMNVFGEKNTKVYDIQYKLTNNNIVDAVLKLPSPVGMVPIDSKFPLENYKRMVDRNLDEGARSVATKEFKRNVKKHIDDIFDKYVSAPETSDQAVLFIPAEAIFAEINAYHYDLVEYSQKKKIWLASPTTFMATLTAIQVLLNNIERSKYAHIIQEELFKLSQEFGRYRERWDKLNTRFDSLTKDVKDLHVTSNKISKEFDRIAQVDFEGGEKIPLPNNLEI
jgi:DNA recombination protein RmuC